MAQRVLVTFLGNQVSGDGMSQKIEFLTEGKLHREQDAWVLEYQESYLSGMEGTDTRIVLQKDSVSLQRTGTFDAHFVFEKWKTYSGWMDTPYGEVELALFPTNLRVSVDDTAGSGWVDVEYDLHMFGECESSQLLLRFQSPESLN